MIKHKRVWFKMKDKKDKSKSKKQEVEKGR